jgi:hypothetical protein
MSRSTRALALGLAMTVCTIAGVRSSPSRQKAPPINQETVLSFVHDFLGVFYPELLTKGHTLRLCVSHPAEASWRTISGVYFTVTPEWPSNYAVPYYLNGKLVPETRPNPNNILLDGSIWLPDVERPGRIEQVLTFRQATGQQKLEAVHRLVQSHPGWSDDNAVAALKQAGARYGPSDKEAFVKSLPLVEAEPFLGRLVLNSVEFNHLRNDRSAGGLIDVFEWQVRAAGHFDDGTQTSYVFSFEPFDGRLTSLNRY